MLQKPNISPIAPLQKFISTYPDQKLHGQFELLSQQFPVYRAIKGDGNCFYRAFAFLYLASCKCEHFQETFPRVQWSYLKDNSFIESNRKFQSELFTLWNQYIKKLGALSREKRQQKLQKLFNQMQVFDELMVGYFRSVNQNYLRTNHHKFKTYACKSDNPADHEIEYEHFLQKVGTFAQQSDEIQVCSLAEAMKTRVTLECVTENNLVAYEYMDNLENKLLYIFYRPGHYDIIYRQTNDRIQPVVLTPQGEPQIKMKSRVSVSSTRGSLEHKQSQYMSKAQETYNSVDYNLKYNNSRNSEKPASQDNSFIKVPDSKKSVIQPSYTDSLQRVWVELLGAGVLGLIGYAFYNQSFN